MKARLIRLPEQLLRSMKSSNLGTSDLYYHPNLLVREMFWYRLAFLIKNLDALDSKGIWHTSEKEGSLHQIDNDRVLDFGCGGGLLFPTLSRMFREVYAIDLDISDAKKTINFFNLANLKLFEGDAKNCPFPDKFFDVIIAADILEHFSDMERPILEIKRLLRKNGKLLVTAPNENSLQKLSRKLFKLTPPPDHYHTGTEILLEIEKEFLIEKLAYLPINLKQLSVFIFIKAVLK